MKRFIGVLACAVAAAAGVLVWQTAFRPEAPKPRPKPAPVVAPDVAPRVIPQPKDRDVAGSRAADCPIRLREVTEECGVAFQHVDGGGGHEGRHYILEAMSTGLAALDYDRDGLVDVYFPNGAPLPGSTFDRPPRHALYKNLGGWKFREVAEPAGVACTVYGMGITVGDYDNDGWPDVYLDNFGPNILLRNNGNGTFSDVTQRAGVPATTPSGLLARKVGAGACFLDADGDGELDLYAGSYIELDLKAHVTRMKQGFPFYPSPQDYVAIPDTLYHNNGDGTFANVSQESGIAAHAGRSMGMTAADYDNDGRTDVFVCNDVQENYLFHNVGQGKFEQVGLLAGVALTPNAEMVANMAVDSGDYSNEGWLSFFTTNYQNQHKMLLHNMRDGMFEDVTLATGADAGCYAYVNWGCGMVDFDNDGHKDIFIGNGHTEDNIERIDRTTAYRCHNALLWNTGKGRFINVSEECGLNALPRHAARGVAFEDLDNDGDLDAVIVNSRERATVLRNMLRENGSKNHWLQVRLEGVKTNRDGVGAHVKVLTGAMVQLDEVHSGRGYQSHWGSRLHFGLGPHDRADRIEIHWIGGGTDLLENVAADQQITVTEGTTGSRATE